MTTLTQSNRARGAMTKMKLMFAAMLMMIGLQAKAEKKVYTEFVESTGTLTYYYDDQMSSRTGVVEEYDFDHPSNHFASYADKIIKAVIDPSMKEAKLTTASYMFSASGHDQLNALTSIEGMENLNTVDATSMSFMFYGCSSLKSINLSYFNTEKVTNMIRLFSGCSSLTSLNISSFNTANVEYMRDMFNGCSSLTSLNLSSFNTANVTNMKDMFYGCSSLTSLNLSNFNTEKVTDMYGMFAHCKSLTSLDISSFNTSSVTSLNSMFYQCKELTSLDVSSFNTTNVTEMGGMFEGCYSLKSIDVSGFNTSNVIAMSRMFMDCRSLTTLDLSHFNTSEVKHMERMFNFCASLISLDISNFDINKVEDMEWMFASCDNLTSIYCNNDWSKSSVLSDGGMFSDCVKLRGGKGTEFNESYTDKTYARPDGGEEAPGYFTHITPLQVYTEFVESTGTLTYYYDGKIEGRTGIVEEYNSENPYHFASYNTKVTKAVVDESMKDAPLTDMALMFSSADSKNHLIALTSIEGLENLNTANVNYMDYMFDGCSSLESLDLSSFNTEAVKGMSHMFGECSSLSSLDISSFNTSNVKEMVNMFKDCSSLTSLDLSSFKATNLTNTISMFEGCSALTSLDLSNFNTAKVTNMKDMFSGCSSLTSLDLSSFNTANVETMQYMFLHCSSLISLNLSSFNTANVTNMSNMFHDCASLKLLDLSSFNTANVKEMSGMFAGCSSLESLNLSSFNTAKVTKMTDLFRKCSSLTSLDLSLFNTANVTDMSSMFMNCSSLTALDLSSFDTGNVERMTGMFDNCSSLTSLNLTSFNTAKVKNMDSMFESCSSLTKLDLSNFSVNSLSNTRRMFIFCNHLTTIYCNSDWNQGNQIYGTYMFEDCKNLKGGKGTTYRWIFEDQIIYARPDGGKDAPGYFTLKKTGKLVYSEFDEKYSTLTYYYDDKMYDDIQRPGIKEEYDHAEDPYFKRFEGYNGKVQTVRIDPSMKEAELLSTAFMFINLSKAKAIVGIENLNTAKVQSMMSMFEGCSSLVNLDLCTFDVQQVTNMSGIFEGCFQLSTIYCDKDWSQSATIQQSTDMFHKCFVLDGSKGTHCDGENSIDKSYARPDGSKERPGYFTLPTEEAIIDGVNYLLNNKIHTATVLPLPEGKYEGNIIIPEVVKYCGTNYTVVGIGDKAFKDCDGLTSITVEAKNPLTLGEDAFEGVPVDIPVYVPDESKLLYENTEGWKVFEDFHTTPHIIDGICYELDPTTYFAKVVGLPNGKYKGNIIVPQEVTYEGVKYKVNSVGKYAFARCPELISVSLPSTITDIADFAFLGSPALTTINIPDDNKTYCDIEGIVYSKNKKTLLFYPNGRYGGYEVPEGTLRIEHNVFNGTDLRWMILPESLKEIGSFALDQTNLVWLVSKSTSPAVAEELAFYGLNKQIPVYVPEESLEAYQTADEWKEFTNIISGIKRHVQVGDFYYDLYLWNKYADVVGAVNEPSGTLVLLSEIDVDVNTLYGISGSGDENDLVHFTVTGIGKEAFKLDQMNEVIIPGTITSIGMHAFYGCTSLMNVELSEGLEEIKAFAFAKCQKMASIELPESLVTIGQDALAACGFADVTIPDKVKTIGGYAFEDCKNLKWVEIGTSVRHIGNCAFMNANQLLGVFANGETAPLLGENVFLNCSNLKQVYVPCGALDHYRRVWKQYFQLILNDPISYYYTITATPSEHGTVEVPTSDCNHNLTAIPDEGYQFVKWTDGNTDNPRFIETPKENLVFEAIFEPKNYRWLVESSNDEWGYVSSPKTLEWYPYNTEMIAIAVPKDGYKFIKWNDGYMNTPYNFNLTKDTYLRAIFIPENEEPEIPQFTMQVTAAKIRWWKKDEAFLYSLDIYMDEECTQLFASYLFDKNGYIVAVSLAPKAPSRNWKEEQETEFQYNITGLTADTKYYYRMKTTDEEGKLIYTDEGNFRTLNSAVYVVVQHIDAIGEVTYTSECGTNIELAREAYDALSDENKALVFNYATLVEAEKQYAELEAAAKAAALADAKEQLSAVIADLTTLQLIAQEYGMSETAETLGNAITAATAVLNSDAVSAEEVLTAMWTALMALDDAKDALLLAAQAQFKDALDALLLPDDSEACILIIENAKSAVDELCLDSEKGLAENVEDIMAAGEGIYNQAKSDLEAQRKAEEEEQPTGIEEVESQKSKVESQKVLIDGQLYIMYKGQMYNVQGGRVR